MKLTHVKAARLTLNTGEVISVELIGKGRFSEAWRNCTNVYVITRSRNWGTDYAKEMLSRLDDEDRGKHIPKVEYLDDIDGRDDRVYKMPLYQPLTAKCGVAWAQFKVLQTSVKQAFNEAQRRLAWNEKFNLHNAVDINDRTIELCKERGLDTGLVECLQLLRDNITNYGSTWLFEFRKANLYVDTDGNLILLDVLFDMEVMKQARKAVEARHEARW